MHTCSCIGAQKAHGKLLCPVAAACRLYENALAHPSSTGGGDVGAKPLWPTVVGGFTTKEAAARTLKELAALTGTPADLITGHSCRVTGAQAMAVAGVEVWAIQAFCRWDSAAVLGYVRSAHLSVSYELSAKVAKGLELARVSEGVYQRVRQVAKQAQVEEIADLVLEKAMAGPLMVAGGTTKAQVWKEAGGTASELAKQFDQQVDGDRRPRDRFVRGGTGADDLWHVAKNGRVCWCGWRWTGMSPVTRATTRPSGGQVCLECFARAPP